jgi:high-affinity Fe2+/Pb2+ permease
MVPFVSPKRTEGGVRTALFGAFFALFAGIILYLIIWTLTGQHAVGVWGFVLAFLLYGFWLYVARRAYKMAEEDPASRRRTGGPTRVESRRD